MSQTTRDARTEELPLSQAATNVSTVLQADPIEAEHGKSTKDRILVAIMIICICVFVGALATFVLYPALTTLAGSPASTWTGQGP